MDLVGGFGVHGNEWSHGLQLAKFQRASSQHERQRWCTQSQGTSQGKCHSRFYLPHSLPEPPLFLFLLLLLFLFRLVCLSFGWWFVLWQRKAGAMIIYPFLFVSCWLAGSIRHFVKQSNHIVWLQIAHFASISLLGCLQCLTWVCLNSAVRNMVYQSLCCCRCFRPKPKEDNPLLATGGTSSMGDEEQLERRLMGDRDESDEEVRGRSFSNAVG